MRFNAIAGLPRSGSTLLCNLLNQNPKFEASSTSCIGRLLGSMSAFLSNSPEIKSELAHNKAGTETRIVETMRAVVSGWYARHGHHVTLFDKDRTWAIQSPLLFQLFPEATLIVCVRDLRAVFGSIEKQQAKFPALDTSNTAIGRTKLARADSMFSPQGMIGGNVTGIEDMLRRKDERVEIVQFETLVKSPKLAMQSLYSALGEDYFEHDFDNVEATATDLDALYLNKFPHEGSGKVEPPADDWADHVSPDIAQLIMRRFPGYNRAFGYR